MVLTYNKLYKDLDSRNVLCNDDHAQQQQWRKKWM